MKNRFDKLLFLLVFLCGMSGSHAQAPVGGRNPASRPEEIEWTWEVRPSHIDPKLPNVLLLGDSITRNYFPEVQRQLADVANVYLFATSASVGDPRLARQLDEFAFTENVPFNVVHFNNGMHGWIYSEDEYKNAFPSLLHELHAIAPSASLIWTTITPVKAETSPGPTNARIDARNSIALAFIAKAGIRVDDQHELMTHHSDQYQDNVHFNPAGAAIQGRQAAQLVRASLVENAHN
jgi:GDSL-like Lipase/Acylhydrolase family